VARPKKETPGSTTRLIIDHVHRRLGDAGVEVLLDRAGLAGALDQLLDERRWLSYDERIAMFEAAAGLLDDPAVAERVGESILDSPIGELVPVLRALGGPGPALERITDASDAFSPHADMRLLALDERHADIEFRLHEGLEPSPHDCGFARGILSQIGPVFGLPPAEVEQRACRALGDESCLIRVSWAPPPRPRRLARRARREHLRGLTARFWELESATPGLVSDGDPSAVLDTIAARAADAVGASGHVLVLTDPDGATPRVTRHGLVGDTAALVDDIFQDLVEKGDDRRLVVALESERRRYGHLVLLFDTEQEHLPETRTIVEAHARHVAVALDAAHAIRAAQVREETASVLLHLARSLSELTTVADVASRLAAAVPTITGAEQAAVLLLDRETEMLRVQAAVGISPELQLEVDELAVPAADVGADLPPDVEESPSVITRSVAQGMIADLMARHGHHAIALVPVRLRGELRGMITCGWIDGVLGERAVLDERLQALADQAATALENATLLEQVRHQALHDGLTGLPNQTLFADRVMTEIRRAKRNGSRLAVGVLDLDRFKTVNDSLGHAAGDVLLAQVAERLLSVMRAPDTIARMGGDEFTLLLPDVGECGEHAAADRILEAFVPPFDIEGHRLRVSPSIGLAAYPDDGETFAQLFKCADVAMYRAKEKGRNTWASYASGMAERTYDRLTLEADLYRALQRRELRVAYQPIARLADGHVIGTEALVRWAHPTLGLLLPGEFLPIAEDLGLMAEVDGWVLRHACLELGAAAAKGVEVGRVAVNLSARTLLHPALERLVGDALAAGGIEPARLVVEVSEEITADPSGAVSDALRALRTLGVRVALDDFGRGHSSLGRLEQLPIDQLKVDAIFLGAIHSPDAPAPVAEAIVAMGKGLGLEVLAEGVETEEQRAFVTRVGFDLAQGWAFGRPTAGVDYAGASSRTA